MFFYFFNSNIILQHLFPSRNCTYVQLSTIYKIIYDKINFRKVGEKQMESMEYGYVKIRLNELLKEKKVSKNKLAAKAQMQRTQLNNYCKQKMQRVDLAIIARICSALDCGVSDVLEYIPPQEKPEK